MPIMRVRIGRGSHGRKRPKPRNPAPQPVSEPRTEPERQAVADTDFPGRNARWQPVNSSWIDALRFVPTARVGNSKYATGYIDMRVKWRGRRYRYGPGIKQESFQTWVVAASRGKYWWRYFTRRWSPAEKF